MTCPWVESTSPYVTKWPTVLHVNSASSVLLALTCMPDFLIDITNVLHWFTSDVRVLIFWPFSKTCNSGWIWCYSKYSTDRCWSVTVFTATVATATIAATIAATATTAVATASAAAADGDTCITACTTSSSSSSIISSSDTLQWRQNEYDVVSGHHLHDCLLNRLFGRRWKKHQSSVSLAFVRGIRRGPVNSPHKGPVTRKMYPFDDVIMMKPMCVRVHARAFVCSGPNRQECLCHSICGPWT